MWLKNSAMTVLVMVPMVSAIAAVASQTETAGVPKMPYIVSAPSGQTTLNITEANNDEISAAIEALSRQAQVKEEALARLATELEQKYEKYEQVQQATAWTNRGILAALPVDGYRISSRFGQRQIFGQGQFHKGIDLAAPAGSPVYATGPGIVTRAGWVGGYGQLVEIDHGAGLMSRYGHNSRLHVRVGDRVAVRQRIADVGCTGRCTGPHVHYEVLKNGRHTDPSIHLAMANR